jgi:hypothetical protein
MGTRASGYGSTRNPLPAGAGLSRVDLSRPHLAAGAARDPNQAFGRVPSCKRHDRNLGLESKPPWSQPP